MNTSVNNAVILAMREFEAQNIVCDSKSIQRRIETWYNHTDETDPKVLVACALTGKDWFPGATYQFMKEAKDYWFPEDPYSLFSIEEIETAQKDSIWW